MALKRHLSRLVQFTSTGPSSTLPTPTLQYYSLQVYGSMMSGRRRSGLGGTVCLPAPRRRHPADVPRPPAAPPPALSRPSTRPTDDAAEHTLGQDWVHKRAGMHSAPSALGPVAVWFTWREYACCRVVGGKGWELDG